MMRTFRCPGMKHAADISFTSTGKHSTMKHSKRIIFALTAFFIMAGPVHADTGGESDQEHSMEGNGNDTMESIGSYTAEQRDKALEAGRKTLEAMDERIESMEAWLSRHWDSLSDEAREKRDAQHHADATRWPSGTGA